VLDVGVEGEAGGGLHLGVAGLQDAQLDVLLLALERGETPKENILVSWSLSDELTE